MRLEREDLAVDARSMKGFFKMIAMEQKGMISDHLSINTLSAYLTRFVTACQDAHGIKISDETVREVRDVRKAMSLMLYRFREVNG